MKNYYKNTAYNAFGFVFPLTVALLSTPYIVHKLTPAVYGIYVLATSLMGLMSFLDLGFGQGIIKFVSYYEARKDYRKINDIISVSLIVYFVMGMVGFICIYALADFLARDVFKVSPDYIVTASRTFKVVAFGFMINFVNGVFSNVPKALQRYDISVKIQNAVWFSVTMATVVLLYYGKGLVEVITAWLVVQSVGVLIYYFFSRRILPTLKITVRFDRDVFKEIFGFSFFTAANSVTGNIVVKVDKMIIGGFLGTGAVAYYNIPFMIAQMGGGFIGAVTQHLFPSVSYMHGLGNTKQLVDLYKRSFRYVISLSLIITIALMLLGNSFLKLWMGQEFASKSSGILPILALVFFFSCITSVTLWFYTGLGYSRINLVSSFIGSMCYLVGSLFLIPRFGLYGAATSFALILVPFPAYNYYLVKRILGIDLNWYFSILAKSLLVLFFAFIIRDLFYTETVNIFMLCLQGIGIILTTCIFVLISGTIELKEIILIGKNIANTGRLK